MVISALEGSFAAEADLTSGTELLSVDGERVQLGLEGTATALRGDIGAQVLLELVAAMVSREN